MTEAATLSYAYMQAHPVEAAAVLEGLPPVEVAGLFAAAPARIAAAVLAAMLPATAARALDALEDERSMALLGVLAAQPAALVLRHLPEARRARILGGLPAATSLASRVLLGYGEDTVGAWADPQVLALRADTPAATALERLRQGGLALDRVLVVRPGHKPAGWVSASALLRADARAPLDSLSVRLEGLLAARTPLAEATLHPGWQRSTVLPVVEADERLLGVLTSDALARALGHAAPEGRAPLPDSLASVFALGYWAALSGLVEAFAGLLPKTAPIDADRER